MSDTSPAGGLPIEVGTTSDERTMAVLAHVLQLVGGWIAPLVIFFVKRQSRFITFHALQVLLFQGVCLFLQMFVIAGVFMAIGLGLSLGAWTPQHTSTNFPPLFFLFFGLFAMGSMAFWLIKLLLAIIYSVKAGSGQWAEYPILGRFARKILNIGPGGSVVAP
jgi:uncharacterized membrane protein